MTGEYLTVKNAFETEYVIEKSRFIGKIEHVESEEQARELIAAVKKKHAFATHVCHAFIADKDGLLCRYSDDGEPQGTAGLPILEVLKNKGLRQVLVTVTRYFGGIKLGAGGLVRAYTRSAADACNGAETARMTYATTIRFSLPYEFLPVYDKVTSTLAGEETARVFDSAVQIERTVPQSEEQALREKITALFMGKVSVEKIGESYHAFLVE